MKRITFYLDFISPFAWLAFEQLPKALAGQSYSVDYKPVLLGAMLRHHGQLGPAEVPAKRDWTYRHVMWLGQSLGVPLRMPAQHPFNPLPLLRLALACAPQGQPKRWVCESIFRHVWSDGADALDPQRLQALRSELAPGADSQSADTKERLRRNTEEAIAAGVFGVPTCVVDGRLFWGLDALPMLRAYLAGDAWFGSGAWETPSLVNFGIERAPGR